MKMSTIDAASADEFNFEYSYICYIIMDMIIGGVRKSLIWLPLLHCCRQRKVYINEHVTFCRHMIWFNNRVRVFFQSSQWALLPYELETRLQPLRIKLLVWIWMILIQHLRICHGLSQKFGRCLGQVLQCILVCIVFASSHAQLSDILRVRKMSVYCLGWRCSFCALF